MLSKVQAGQKIKFKSEDWNQIVDVVNAVKSGGVPSATRGRTQDTKAGIILVKNMTGSDRGIYDCVGLDAPLFTPADNEDSFRNRIVMKSIASGVEPGGKFAVLQEPIAAGELGYALIDGITLARVNFTQDEATHVGIVKNEYKLTNTARDDANAYILWKESGTGTKWALIRTGNPAQRETYAFASTAMALTPVNETYITFNGEMLSGFTWEGSPKRRLRVGEGSSGLYQIDFSVVLTLPINLTATSKAIRFGLFKNGGIVGGGAAAAYFANYYTPTVGTGSGTAIATIGFSWMSDLQEGELLGIYVENLGNSSLSGVTYGGAALRMVKIAPMHV